MSVLSESEVIVAHQSCPDCGSRDALSEYSDGHTHCFSCDTTRFPDHKSTTAPKKQRKEMIAPEDLQIKDLRKRGITRKTCERYGYGTSRYQGKIVQVATYYDDTRTPVSQKCRTADKEFFVLGQSPQTFYGQQLFSGGKSLIITEGEIDCLTVSQVFGNKYPVVSLPLGATSAKKIFKNQQKWLEGFESVVIMFDQDEAGQKAVQDVCGLLPPNKLKIATLPMKDPNECLLHEKGEEIKQAFWNAKSYRPEEIVNAQDLWDEVNTDNVQGYPLPWDVPLNEMIMGIRKGELTLLTAGTGVGKSTLFRELQYHFGHTLHLKVGMMMLEEAPRKSIKGLMSIHMGKRLHLNRQAVSEEEYRKAFDDVTGTGNFIVYKHFGSLGENSLLSSIRYMAVVEQCDFIFLDHISIAISGLESDNERQLIDRLMTNFRSLVEETGVGLCVISHLTRKSSAEKSHEEGGRVSLNQLRGSGALGQLSDTIIAVERNQQDDGQAKNLMLLRSLKCRETGDTGAGGYLFYDKSTGRLGCKTDQEVDVLRSIEEDETTYDCPF